MPKAAELKHKPQRVTVTLPRELVIKLKVMGAKEANGSVSPVVERLVREAKSPFSLQVEGSQAEAWGQICGGPI
jgi:hypothetical protein